MNINKHVYTWIGTFLFGSIGVDKFMRHKIGIGILKLLTFGICLLIPPFRKIGLWAVWPLIDWIIALTKLGKYEKDFVFSHYAGKDGVWDKDYTKEALEKKAREKAAYELQEKRREEEQKQKKEKYKKDILSGAVSYDGELQKITDELSKYKSYFKEKSSEILSMVQEYTKQTSTGSWDTGWYSRITDEIKDAYLESPPYDIRTNLSDLREIKQDARIKVLEDEITELGRGYCDCHDSLSDLQFKLRQW